MASPSDHEVQRSDDTAAVDRTRGETAGFTLVEMLVVLVLTSVMATMLVSGFRQLQGLAQAQRRERLSSELDAVIDHMSRELAGALPIPLLHEGYDGPRSMVGSSGSIRFVAVIRTGFADRALRETSYTQAPSADVVSLTRTSRQNRIDRNDEISPAQTDELYSGQIKARFSYMTGDDNEKLIWTNVWTDKTGLPAAVRIELSASVGKEEILHRRTVTFND